MKKKGVILKWLHNLDRRTLKKVGLAGFVILITALALKHQPKLSLADYANKVIAQCANDSLRPTCYDREIPKLMSAISMEDAFKVTSLVQQTDRSYQYCHVLGHDLSAQEVRKDPSKWKEVLVRCPSGVCSNGCIHGGMQERFRASSLTDEQISALKPDLSSLCEKRGNWNPTNLEQASCYHALGHLTMYLTNADLQKSTNICQEISVKDGGRDYTQLCFDGVFMQIFQPLEPEDFALVKGKQPTKDQVSSFCESFSGIKKGSCLSESWPLFRDDLKNPDGLVSFCGREDPGQQDRCYDAMIFVLTAQFGLDEQKITPYCAGLPGLRSGRCFANAAARLIETDYRNISRSVGICQSAGSRDPDNECFKQLLLYSTYNFHPGSSEFRELCGKLPEPWKTPCLSGKRSS